MREKWPFYLLTLTSQPQPHTDIHYWAALTNLEQTKKMSLWALGHITAVIRGSASVTAISGGTTWAVLYAKYFVLVVCYVNVFLVVIYDKKAVALAQLQDAVATGLHPFSQEWYFIILYYTTTWEHDSWASFRPHTWSSMCQSRSFLFHFCEQAD